MTDVPAEPRRGQRCVDSFQVDEAVSSYLGVPSEPTSSTDSALGVLTAREQEVWRLLAYGHTNKEIGDLFHISIRTVQTHRRNIMAKLELTGRTELVAAARPVDLCSFRQRLPSLPGPPRGLSTYKMRRRILRKHAYSAHFALSSPVLPYYTFKVSSLWGAALHLILHRQGEETSSSHPCQLTGQAQWGA